MNIFIAGASGAVGRALIPQLIEHGHTVTGTTRSPDKADPLRALGATPVVVDGLDRAGMINAVKAVEPDVVIHQMTALSSIDLRHFEQSFALTNRLRTEGTDTILAAAGEVGARVIVQSFAGWPYEPTGDWVKDEDAPLMAHPPKPLRTTFEAIRYIEDVVPKTGGMVLRYGGFYGPGTGLTPGGEQWEMIRARKFPIVGDGGGMWSLCHIEDAASATVAAIEHPVPGGVFNICDDEPVPAREFLPAIAKVVGAKPPRHIPRWIARLIGPHLVHMTVTARGASNKRAKEVLGWKPSVPTWREGFAQLSTVS
jgi:nucleoside-diphosphate-sugar epimerase